MPHAFQHHFRRHDPTLHAVIRRAGPFTLRPQRDRFQMLVRSIVSQQISTSAARTIYGRLETAAGPRGIKPDSLASLDAEQLRTVGLSRQKASYISDLAQKVSSNEVRLSRFGHMDDEDVIAELVQVKGIGRWTAQMFLIFALGRQDVFPIDDLGVRTAIDKLYGFTGKQSKDEYLEIGRRWSPHATVGSWYCWRFLDLERKERS
jgi:DNA-3-methyladenine glycosylase II